MSTGLKWLKLSLLGSAAMCFAALPALGDVPNGRGNQNYPEPGTLNYVQGSAYLQGQQLNDKNLGNSEMAPGQVLETTAGKAEVLLTPGVFLRLDDHSAVKMISADISHTQVQLLKGEAGIEVDEIHPQNDLEVLDQSGVTTRLVQRGFYEFLANPPKVLVFTGEAQVETGDGNHQDVKKHHEMALQAGAQEKPRGMKMKNAEDSLFNWSKLRSQYLAEANQKYVHEYGYAGNPGWYWNPWGMGWDMAWGPRWGWGPGWGWGPAWGPAWDWGGPGFWGGPGIYYHREPDYDDFRGGDVHGGYRGGSGAPGGSFQGGALRGGGSFHEGRDHGR